MSTLKAKIKSLRRQNASDHLFIPEAALLRLVTEDEVRAAVVSSDIKPHQRDEVIAHVIPGGKKIFAILLLNDCLGLLQKFIEANRLQDARLPFAEKTLIKTVRLSDNDATDFIAQQWVLTAPTFQRGTLNRRLEAGCELPFKEDKRSGGGGFGTIFEVVLDPDHQTLDPTFPSKFVRKEMTNDDAHEHELDNLAILNSMKHPNLVELLSSYTHINRHNLLFPLAKHGSLRKWLDSDHGPDQSFPDDVLIVALAGLSSAVAHLHDFTAKTLDLELIGCHHDLKPENILVTDTTFILADFGLSRLKPSHQDSESPFKSRTDDYVAPECEDWDNDYEQGSVHRSSDIWSFGCIIAEIVTHVSLGKEGVKRFRAARRHQVPGSTFFSFHHGPTKSSEAVESWLFDLEESSSKSFALIIQLVKRMLSLNPLRRPKAQAVRDSLRFVALAEVTAIISDQFDQMVKNDTVSLDKFLEKLRFMSWRYALGVLGIENESEMHRRVDLSHNILNQFDKLRDILALLRNDLRSRLSPDNLTSRLEVSQLSKFNDELHLFLDHRQARSSGDYFRTTICQANNNIFQRLHEEGSSSVLAAEVRMRFYIKHFQHHPVVDAALGSAKQFDATNVDSLVPFGQGENHHVAKLVANTENEEPRPVWVEWHKHGKHSIDDKALDKLTRRTAQLAELLSLNTPKGFRTLKCSGFFHSVERTAFGMVFDFPEASGGGLKLSVIALSTVIAKTQNLGNMPDLDDRFKLALTLATAVFELHTVDWLHKGLMSDNVLFFHDPTAPIAQLDLAPWIVGFNHSRPDDPLGFSSGLSRNAAESHYQHPAYIEDGRRYRREFDYYSLGIILLEIANWEPITDLTKGKKWKGTYEDRRQRLLERLVPLISKSMGRSYAEAVEFCIRGPRATDESVGERSAKEGLLEFSNRVVTPLSSFLS